MKFGRLPRQRNPLVPHFSALIAGNMIGSAPVKADWTEKLPSDLGMYYNDRLGDCTCAGIYHALQVFSSNVGAVDSQPEANALRLYEQACGYNPMDPATDCGGVEQEVLRYVMTQGAPMGILGADRHRLSAFVEIDPRNVNDVKIAIAEGGLVYIGFSVPDGLPQAPGSTWDVPTSQVATIGGHCVVLAGYEAFSFKAISWGGIYTMTAPFFNRYVDEVYMIADPDWFNASGFTPGGLTLATLEAQMSALKEQA